MSHVVRRARSAVTGVPDRRYNSPEEEPAGRKGRYLISGAKTSTANGGSFGTGQGMRFAPQKQEVLVIALMYRGCLEVRTTGWSIGPLLLSLWLAPGVVLGSQEVPVVDFGLVRDGFPQGWELTEKEGKADVAIVMNGTSPVLRLRSNSSSFGIQKEVDVDLKQTPYQPPYPPLCLTKENRRSVSIR